MEEMGLVLKNNQATVAERNFEYTFLFNAF